MKLVRFRHGAEARIGAVKDSHVIDLRGALTAALEGAGVPWETAAREAENRVPESMREFLSLGDDLLHVVNEAVEFAEAAPHHESGGHSIRLPLESAHLLAPVADPQKVICIGQNYKDHCEEQNQPIPPRAIIFAKFPTSITGPLSPIVLTRISSQVDYEAELAFVVGKPAKNVPEERAKEYIAGYMCLHDVSARDVQLHPDERQWIRGKSPDTFAPIGPYLVTADEITDPHALDIELTLNGEVRQKSNTSNLIFNCYHLLSYISQSITLLPGDVVATGTPGGVGMYSDPQVFLKPGDEVSVTIEGLGTLTNPVVAEGAE
jgi:2-keto-4-pentenoate hydratase/2-oxohepta-3-ene-1,7-dioic acid hydratase in catechol pathway